MIMKKKVLFILILVFPIYLVDAQISFKSKIADKYCLKLGYSLTKDYSSGSKLCVLPNGQKVKTWFFLWKLWSGV